MTDPPISRLTATDAHAMAWPDLVWAHFSRPRYGLFDERVAAAAAAGYAGIGLFHEEYARLRQEEGRSAAQIAEVLDRHGTTIAEIEVARGWWATDDDGRAAYARQEDWIFEMADHFGSRYLQLIGGTGFDLASAYDQLGGVADRCAAHGLLVGIEWLPYTNIPDAATAQRVVQAVDRPNLGYCADIWHHTRGANDLDQIRALEPERVFSVQMNDGPRDPDPGLDYKADCLAGRVPPGEGQFDCVGFVRLLMEMGVTAPISIEVCNPALWAGPIDQAAQRSADGMRAVLAAATS